MLRDTINRTRRSVTFFGAAGSLEGFTAKVSTARKENGARKLSLRIKGVWWSFCGSGSMHTIPIDIYSSSWDSERDSMALHIIEARAGNVDAAESLVNTLIQLELDDLDPDVICDCASEFEDVA